MAEGSNFGRRSLLTPELVEFARQAKRLGAPDRTVFGALEITEACFYNWLAAGRGELERIEEVQAEIERHKEEKPNDYKGLKALQAQLEVAPRLKLHVEFFQAVRTGPPKLELELLGAARQAALKGGKDGGPDGKLALQMLEVVNPDAYSPALAAARAAPQGPSINIDATGGDVLVVEGLTPADFQAAGEMLAQRGIERRRRARELAAEEAGAAPAKRGSDGRQDA